MMDYLYNGFSAIDSWTGGERGGQLFFLINMFLQVKKK